MDRHDGKKIIEYMDYIISISEYDEEHLFMTIYKEHKNAFTQFMFRGFWEEMKYWDFVLETGIMNNEDGFIMDKEDCKMIEMETEQFIKENMMV